MWSGGVTRTICRRSPSASHDGGRIPKLWLPIHHPSRCASDWWGNHRRVRAPPTPVLSIAAGYCRTSDAFSVQPALTSRGRPQRDRRERQHRLRAVWTASGNWISEEASASRGHVGDDRWPASLMEPRIPESTPRNVQRDCGGKDDWVRVGHRLDNYTVHVIY